MVWAQEGGGEGVGDSLTAFVGHMLPNQILGVEEILPFVGGRYGLSTSLGVIEVGALNAHAYGVDFTNFDISMRSDFPFEDGFAGLIYGGLDLNWYIPQNESERKTETGFHIGVGAMMSVASMLWLRSDLRFMLGPGTSLFVLFGLEYR